MLGRGDSDGEKPDDGLPYGAVPCSPAGSFGRRGSERGKYDRVMDVRDLADAIRADLTSGTYLSDTLRLVRQFIMNFDRGADFEALTSTAPPSTGDPRWDALIAGVTEDIAFRLGYKVPSWTVIEPLDEWWFVTPVAKLEPTAFVESPPALSRRGVYIRRASLVNR